MGKWHNDFTLFQWFYQTSVYSRISSQIEWFIVFENDYVKNNYFYIQLQISEVFRHLILCFLGPEFLEVHPFLFPSFPTYAHAPWCHHIIIPDNENPIVEGIMCFFFIIGSRWKIKEARFPSSAFHQSPN